MRLDKVITVFGFLFGVALLLAVYIYTGMVASKTVVEPVYTDKPVVTALPTVHTQSELLDATPVMSDEAYIDLLTRLQTAE